MNDLYITVKNQEFKVKLNTNSSVDALLQQMPLTITMEELHGNEKYYYLDQRLPTNTTRISQIEAGDLMLYGDNCLVLFYQSFSTTYSYTRVGHIENSEQLQGIVGNGSIVIDFNIK